TIPRAPQPSSQDKARSASNAIDPRNAPTITSNARCLNTPKPRLGLVSPKLEQNDGVMASWCSLMPTIHRDGAKEQRTQTLGGLDSGQTLLACRVGMGGRPSDGLHDGIDISTPVIFLCA